MSLWQNWFQTGRVTGRVEAAFAAAALFRAGVELEAALTLANMVTRDLDEQGRLHSTLDSIAAMAMFRELQARSATQPNGRLRLDGQEMKTAQAVHAQHIQRVEAIQEVTILELIRGRVEDWTRSDPRLPIVVALEKEGRPAWTLHPGDAVQLRVKIESRYQAGDIAWVCLPDSLSGGPDAESLSSFPWISKGAMSCKYL